MESLATLLPRVRACTLCVAHLPHKPRPILQVDFGARVLIAGQAPGRKVHETGIPFDDASGKRLREWMGVTHKTFYDPTKIAILPMGFCYPRTGKSGDLPPRPECAPAWRHQLLSRMPQLEVTLVIGQYAQIYHLSTKESSLTKTVQSWRIYWPKLIPLPHPSPRNNIWLKRNPWFDKELVPALRTRISEIFEGSSSSTSASRPELGAA